MVLRADDAVLREILAAHDAWRAERETSPFRATHTALPATIELERGLLWQSLRNEASTLEIETRGMSLLAAMLAQAAPAHAKHHERPLRSRRQRDLSHAVAVLLASQPECDWSLAELAQRVRTSPFHLARRFRAPLDEPIHRYQLRLRLALSLEQVLDSSSALTAIAMALDFATPSHFTAAFSRTYGITPSRLRRQARSRQANELRKILTVTAPHAD